MLTDSIADRAQRLRHVRLDVPTARTLADMRAVVEDWFSLREAGEAAVAVILDCPPTGLSDELCCEVVVRMGLAGFRDTRPALPAEDSTEVPRVS